MASTRTPSSSNAFNRPICAQPLAPPPDNTSANLEFRFRNIPPVNRSTIPFILQHLTGNYDLLYFRGTFSDGPQFRIPVELFYRIIFRITRSEERRVGKECGSTCRS